jgi:peptidoglycan/xylan/chitin deacetylase (PgdA/CDA1 family)
MTKKLRLGILLTVFLLLAGTASAYPRAVLFTFDDARASVYTTGYPIFKNHGYNATFYVVTNLIGEGNDPGQPTINRYQLEELYYDGWDIGDHTRSHEYFVTDSLDLSEQEAEILDGKAQLDDWGFTRASNHLAFPGGQYDSNTALAMTSVGMLTGRTVESFPLTVPPLNNDVFHLTGVRADLDPAYEDEQYTYLESLSSDNVVIYLTHGVDDPGANATTITSGMLENMLDYMDTHHIPVWTITQLGRFPGRLMIQHSQILSMVKGRMLHMKILHFSAR